ncbi:hypothetical protein MAPG_01318 [Magnaporthiopsis poae ATCC 64411]|uniref:DUF7730 domain-containing protein n=1 Tax=Magnaporthiopsis poae (strain ATCC 64411 / 73-15) TaxID=644358 RepID=A0A0C4DND7_MAGP6|nr:hypothetical protein MAPG_01318 [Magnaporthiopsis poae ATCC 64411]
MAIHRRRWHSLLPLAAIRQLRKLSTIRDRVVKRRSGAPRANGSPPDTDPQAAQAAPPPTSMDGTQENDERDIIPAATTSAELESRSDPQLSSLFFSRLPPEIRRLIYIEVFRVWMNGSRRIHVSNENLVDTLDFAPCILDHSHPQHQTGGEDGSCIRGPLTVANANERNILIDANVHASGGPDPNLWWWWRWSLRVRWGDHMDCVSRAVRPRAGSGVRPTAADAMAHLRAMFLTSSRMYSESIATLFETTAFIFKSTADVTQFFETSPHRYTHLIKYIEFHFIYDKDCLYLRAIEPMYPRIASAVARSTPVVGIALWNDLVRALASAVPELSSLRVFIGAKPTAEKEAFWKAFDTVGWRPRTLQLRFRDE